MQDVTIGNGIHLSREKAFDTAKVIVSLSGWTISMSQEALEKIIN